MTDVEKQIISMLAEQSKTLGILVQGQEELRQETKELRQGLEEIRQETKELRQGQTETNQRLDKLEAEVSETKILLENETNRNINILKAAK